MKIYRSGAIGYCLGALFCIAAGPWCAAQAQIPPESNIDSGAALADFWEATPVHYQAVAEQVLDLVGARALQNSGLSAAVAVDFLRMLGGGGGAPYDLTRRRVLDVGVEPEK